MYVHIVASVVDNVTNISFYQIETFHTTKHEKHERSNGMLIIPGDW